MVYVEWCAPRGGCLKNDDCAHRPSLEEGCALDDESKWLMANPQLGRRIQVDTIRNERQALPPEEFARERLGWWDDPGQVEHIFGAEKWARCAIPETEPPTAGIALGVAVSVDRAWSSITAAVPLPGRELVGLVHRQRGTQGLIEMVAELQRKYDCEVAVDSRGPAGHDHRAHESPRARGCSAGCAAATGGRPVGGGPADLVGGRFTAGGRDLGRLADLRRLRRDGFDLLREG